MDYERYVDDLRITADYFQKEHFNLPDVIATYRKSAEIIETLLSNIDTLKQAYRGNCKMCKHKPPSYSLRINGRIVATGPCTTCKYSTQTMIPPFNNIAQDKDNWELKEANE